MRFHAILTLSLAVGTIDAGTQLVIAMPSQVDTLAEAKVIAENLLMGSLAPHCKVKVVDDEQLVALIATRQSTCFGQAISRQAFKEATDKGQQITLLTFDVPLPEPKDRQAVAELLRTGGLHGKVQLVVKEIPAKASPKSNQPPGGGGRGQGQGGRGNNPPPPPPPSDPPAGGGGGGPPDPLRTQQ